MARPFTLAPVAAVEPAASNVLTFPRQVAAPSKAPRRPCTPARDVLKFTRKKRFNYDPDKGMAKWHSQMQTMLTNALAALGRGELTGLQITSVCGNFEKCSFFVGGVLTENLPRAAYISRSVAEEIDKIEASEGES